MLALRRQKTGKFCTFLISRMPACVWSVHASNFERKYARVALCMLVACFFPLWGIIDQLRTSSVSTTWHRCSYIGGCLVRGTSCLVRKPNIAYTSHFANNSQKGSHLLFCHVHPPRVMISADLNLHSRPRFLQRSHGMSPQHLVLEFVQASHDFRRAPRVPLLQPSVGSAPCRSG